MTNQQKTLNKGFLSAPRLVSAMRSLPVILLFCLVFTGVLPAQTAPTRPTVASAVDATFEKVALTFQKRLETFSTEISRRPSLRFHMKTSFYDKHLRKFFADFDGSGSFTGKFPGNIKVADYYITSDGAVAYDINVEKLTCSGEGLKFAFHGDLVLSIDKLIYNLAQESTQIAGTLAISQAADLMFGFLNVANPSVLAECVTKTFQKFSVSTLSVGAAELTEKALSQNNKKLAQMVKESAKDGSMATFLAFSLLKASATSLAAVAGASLGAMVGSSLAPGPGTIVGAFIGKQVAKTGAKTVIYEVTIDIPIAMALKKIAKYQAVLSESPASELARSKIEEPTNFIIKKLKKEIDSGDYKTFDGVLKKIEKFEPSERSGLTSLLHQIGELLRFRLMEEKDWYAAKKLNQLRLKLQEWGVKPLFNN